MSDVVLKTEDLTKRFGRIQAVDGLSMEVNRGDIYGLLGLNGAGKTTTIRMITRLIAPTRGRVLAFGVDVRSHALEVLNRVGAMVEIPAFYPYLSGEKNLELLYGLSGGKEKGRVDDVLALVGLAERGRDRVRTYSQGMRQRLGLAQALLTRPELVILDEPMNGLDPQGILDTRHLIERLNCEHGVTFLISSHLLHEIELTCNRVGIVHEGRLRRQGAVRELLEGGIHISRVRTDPAEAAKAVIEAQGLRVISLDGDLFRLACGPEVLADLAAALHAAGCRVHELTPARATLEEFFLAETGKSSPDAA